MREYYKVIYWDRYTNDIPKLDEDMIRSFADNLVVQ